MVERRKSMVSCSNKEKCYALLSCCNSKQPFVFNSKKMLKFFVIICPKEMEELIIILQKFSTKLVFRIIKMKKFFYFFLKINNVWQLSWLERPTDNREIEGSSPSQTTIRPEVTAIKTSDLKSDSFNKVWSCLYPGVVQLEERLIWVQEAGRSSRLTRTIRHIQQFFHQKSIQVQIL